MNEIGQVPPVLAVPKHVNLHRQIKEIESLGYQVDRLIDRVTGNDSPKMGEVSPGQPEMDPSLMDVLESAPNYLAEQIGGIRGKLDRLQELLF